LTPSGIETATFRLVAQRLSQPRYHVPQYRVRLSIYFIVQSTYLYEMAYVTW